MVLEKMKSGVVKIRLTVRDLKVLGISRRMTPGDIDRLINYSLNVSGFRESYIKVNITIKRFRRGKMEITLTKAQSSIGVPLIFRFDDTNALFSAANEIRRRHCLKILSSDLYLREDNYYLIIYPIIGLSADFFILLGEFSCFEGQGTRKLSALSEHGRLLEKGKAIEKLCL